MAQMRFQVVVFDLYETLITEFDPDWQPGKTPAERLGVPGEVFDQAWRSRTVSRMTRTTDYGEVLREVCRAAGRVIDTGVETAIADLHSERLAAKAKALLEVEQPVLESLRELKATGLRLGLVSNCSVEEVAAWDRSPLAPLFDDVVSPTTLDTPSLTARSTSWPATGSRPCRSVVLSWGMAEAMSCWAPNGLE